jgi:hypothetical protein
MWFFTTIFIINKKRILDLQSSGYECKIMLKYAAISGTITTDKLQGMSTFCC